MIYGQLTKLEAMPQKSDSFFFGQGTQNTSLSCFATFFPLLVVDTCVCFLKSFPSSRTSNGCV